MKLTWLDDTRPYAVDFDDIYYAEENGLAETQYVFIQQNDLEERFQKTQNLFTVGELGFGTGLNFLATLKVWNEKNQSPSARLHYISCEKHPLSPDQIRRALSRWPELKDLTEEFLKSYIELPSGYFRFQFDRRRVTLSLLIGDALEKLLQLRAKVDAWYFDGFSPQKNPDLWSTQIFSAVAQLSHSHTTFATYASTGFVRRNLEEIGFAVEKFRGFGRKREMLKGRYEKSGRDLLTRSVERSQRVAVIGAGISGCAIASALTRRGFQVTLIDKNDSPAAEASGNLAGICLPSLSAEPNTLSQLGLNGLVSLIQLQLQLDEPSPQGLIQFAPHEEKQSKLQRALQSSNIPESFARMIDAHEASELAGIQILKPGLFFKHAGTLSLPRICQKLTASFDCLWQHSVTEVIRENGAFRIDFANHPSREFEIVIFCGAHALTDLSMTRHLPLRKIRGQIAYIESPALAHLKLALCFEHYLTPVLSNQGHVLGASYDREDFSPEVRPEENAQMIESLKRFLHLPNEGIRIRESRVNFRTSRPGQIPLIGPLLNSQGESIENAYIMTSMASRGSIYSIAGAEFLASKISGEPLSLPAAVIDEISPRY